VPTASPTGTPVPTASATPAPTASATPVPTPSPTSLALCVNVGGSTNNFTATQLAGPDNGFSFFNNVIVNATPTPTATAVPVPTPSPTTSTQSITGGVDCDSPTTWPAYGSSNKYEITLVAGVEQSFELTSATTRTIYMSATGSPTTPISGTVVLNQASDGTPPCFFDVNSPGNPAAWLAGKVPSAALSNKIALTANPGVTGTFDIWIV
jgi:hypothetical protein